MAVFRVQLELGRDLGSTRLFVSVNGAERRSLAGSGMTEESFTYGEIARLVRRTVHGALAHLDITPMRFTHVHDGRAVVGPQPLASDTMRGHRLRCAGASRSSSAAPAMIKASSSAAGPFTDVFVEVAATPPPLPPAAKETKEKQQSALASSSSSFSSSSPSPSLVLEEPGSSPPPEPPEPPMVVTASMTKTDAEHREALATRNRGRHIGWHDLPGTATGCGEETVDCVRLPIRADDNKVELPWRCDRPGCGAFVLRFKVRSPRETDFATDDYHRKRGGFYRAHHVHCVADAAHRHCAILKQRSTAGEPTLSYRCGWTHEPEVAQRIVAASASVSSVAPSPPSCSSFSAPSPPPVCVPARGFPPVPATAPPPIPASASSSSASAAVRSDDNDAND